MIKRWLGQWLGIFKQVDRSGESLDACVPAQADLQYPGGLPSARPATWSDVKQLMLALQAQQVDYLLIGGYALNTLGYQRATTDIDLILRASIEQGQRVKRVVVQCLANNAT